MMNKPINFFIIVMLVSVSSILIVQPKLAEGKTPLLTTTPTDLVAIPVSPSQIDLSWNAPTQNYGKVIVGYKIEERLSSGVYYTLVENTGSTLTAYSITGLKTGTTYTYRVSAVWSDKNTSDPSNPASATPTITSAPTKPTPPSSEQTSNVKFDFTPSDGTALVGVILTQGDYVQLLYQKDTRSVIANIASTSQASNNNVKTVLAYQNAHLSDDRVPGPLIATTFSPTQINLWWVPPTQNYGKLIIGYQIEWKRAPGDYIVIDDNTQNTTTRYSVYPLTPGNTYTYRVSAIYNDHTRSNPSNEASATTILTQQQAAQNQQTTTNSSSASSSSKQQTSTITTQVINVKFDFTPVDGKILIGVVLSQSDYQQLL
ncbi:MAG: fibronectin type III domain-containing protein, partial [Thaumarchaeota archaeon]